MRNKESTSWRYYDRNSPITRASHNIMPRFSYHIKLKQSFFLTTIALMWPLTCPSYYPFVNTPRALDTLRQRVWTFPIFYDAVREKFPYNMRGITVSGRWRYIFPFKRWLHKRVYQTPLMKRLAKLRASTNILMSFFEVNITIHGSLWRFSERIPAQNKFCAFVKGSFCGP